MRHALPLLVPLLVGACAELEDEGPVDDAADAADPQATDTGDPVHDPLSRPATPTLAVRDFERAAVCGGCHTQHHAEWSRSSHAYAVVDPVFRALVAVRQADFEGRQDAFCMQCHTAIGTRGGEVVPGFDFEALSPVVQEGVTCVACHRVKALARPYNAGHVLDPGGPIRGPIDDPAEAGFHASEGAAIFRESAFCAGCHDVIELSGLPLERPYQEWLASPAQADGRTCQSCHMPTYPGQAAPGAPERADLHRHTWVGVDVPLAEGFAPPAVVDAIRADVAALLDGAATLELAAAPSAQAGGQLDLHVTVTNRVAGHSLPTGSTFLRQLWLEVVATDATGRVVYETGLLDENGDLRDHWSTLAPYGDADLVTFGSRLVDARGEPVLFPWRATLHTSTAIPPGYARTVTLFVPVPADAVGPVEIAARLRFRSVPPYVLRALDLARYVPDVGIFEVAQAAATIAVEPPGR
ncbi:MAG: hypothetical protein EP329_11265 [Deltaproteobacteria bacterium]|nr:MAG: hypothetical protein EP329_11265 [Deltaproteobacteria bacterium]